MNRLSNRNVAGPRISESRPTRRATIQLHLPEPIASMQEAHGKPCILGVTRVDVRHSVPSNRISTGARQTRQAHRPSISRD